MIQSKKIAILGAGEVGSAIKRIAEKARFKALVRDINRDEFVKLPGIVLHVCIPYKDETFIDIVARAAKDLECGFIIIHSTVVPGTTIEVFKKTKIPTAHSPIRGNHPDLYRAIKKDFVKYVSGITSDATKVAIKHLKDLGVNKVKGVENPKNTELGKLVNTFTYAWSIVLSKWANEISEDLGVDFNFVYTDFLKTYNEGYKKTSPNVVQPILKPIEGSIGGHCLIPNTELLERFDRHGFTSFLLKQNSKYKEK